MDNQTLRERLKDKKKIVVKVGSSSLTHAETGSIDLIKMEKLVRELTDLHNRGKEVILVSSGAIVVGRKTIGMKDAGEWREQNQCPEYLRYIAPYGSHSYCK